MILIWKLKVIVEVESKTHRGDAEARRKSLKHGGKEERRKRREGIAG
jgi:hypothetical protein